MNDIMQRARRMREYIEAESVNLSDDDALEIPEAFPAWVVGKNYAVDDRIRYAEKLYKCVQAHTSQADWTPAATPALWTEVSPSGVIPEWKQPTGAQDAYAKGDKVKHNEKIWVSDYDSNVWEPGVYGWSEVA